MLLRERLGVQTTRQDGELAVLTADGEQFVPRLLELDLAACGLTVRSVSVARPSLDDVFMAYTGTQLDAIQAAAVRGEGRSR